LDFDCNKSLTELEGDDWGDVSSDSYIIQSCYALRKKPICEFTVEDMRIMISQDIGGKYLIPFALERLKENPFVEGMHYPGDLLCAVLRVDKNFLKHDQDMLNQIDEVIRLAESSLSELDDIDRDIFIEAFSEAKLVYLSSGAREQ
jgi:hypothetical protein